MKVTINPQVLIDLPSKQEGESITAIIEKNIVVDWEGCKPVKSEDLQSLIEFKVNAQKDFLFIIQTLENFQTKFSEMDLGDKVKLAIKAARGKFDPSFIGIDADRFLLIGQRYAPEYTQKLISTITEKKNGI